MNWRLSLSLAGLVACRFGGPASNPNEYVASPDATGRDVAVSASTPSGDDASPTPPSRATDALASDDGAASLADDDGGAFDAGFADVLEAGACTASFFSESCPPKSTCVDGGCRELCFCDADCPAGQCCSDTSGPPGFTLCRPCPYAFDRSTVLAVAASRPAGLAAPALRRHPS